MPIFLPRIPVTLIISSSSSCVALSARTVGTALAFLAIAPAYFAVALAFLAVIPAGNLLLYNDFFPTPGDELLRHRLNLYVHACRQIERHQYIDGLLRRLENVDQTLVRPNLESLARLLIDVRRTQNAILVLH